MVKNIHYNKLIILFLVKKKLFNRILKIFAHIID